MSEPIPSTSKDADKKENDGKSESPLHVKAGGNSILVSPRQVLKETI